MKRLYILVALLIACLSVSAQSINEQQAREQAVKFLLNGNNELLNRPLAYCSKATLPTGISSAETKVAGEDAPYYNLSGQKVVPQRKGIYIHNGKKVIIR